jgi:hypothetical protein
MPRTRQSARRSSSKGAKEAETKSKADEAPQDVPQDEGVATLPSENDQELGESSAHPESATRRRSKRLREEIEEDQMQVDNVEAEEPAQAASQPEFVKLSPPAVQPQSTTSAPVTTPTPTPSHSLPQPAAPELPSAPAAPAGEIDKLTKSACTYAWPVYKQPLTRAILNPHVERERALKRKLAAGRPPTGEDPNPSGSKKYWLEMPRGYLAMGGYERVPVWTGDDINAAVYKWYNHRMDVEAKEGEGPAVNGKEIKKSAKEQRQVERTRQVDEDTLKGGRNYVSNDAILQTRYGFTDSCLELTSLTRRHVLYRAEFLGSDPKVAGFRVDSENVIHIRWWDSFLEQRWSGTGDSWVCEAYWVNDQWKELKDVD